MEKAVRFLRDPSVQAVASTEDEKRAFLLSKGISEADIAAALQAVSQNEETPKQPPVPPFPATSLVLNRTRQWLFVLLLAGGTVFYHYRRILVEYYEMVRMRVVQCICKDQEVDRLRGIEEKLGSLETAYKYLQADLAECKQSIRAGTNGRNKGKQQQN